MPMAYTPTFINFTDQSIVHTHTRARIRIYVCMCVSLISFTVSDSLCVCVCVCVCVSCPDCNSFLRMAYTLRVMHTFR